MKLSTVFLSLVINALGQLCARLSGICQDGSLCGPPSCKDGSTCSSGLCTDGTPCCQQDNARTQARVIRGNARTAVCTAHRLAQTVAHAAIPVYAGTKLPGAIIARTAVLQPRLIFARSQPTATDSIPNAVIYGWQDDVPTGLVGACVDANGHAVGCAHIVKVTAYSAARVGNARIPGLQALLPNIYNWSTFFYDYFTLVNRDGDVYVSVNRWDQEHTNSVSFPNGHKLWQYMFHNPTIPPLGPGGLPSTCIGVSLNPNNSGGSACTAGSCVGYGLLPQTIEGLNVAAIVDKDKTALAQAFMLNDNGNGTIDPNAKTIDGKACNATSDTNDNYCACLSAANSLLGGGIESHACARYIAASPQSDAGAVKSGYSSTQDADYSLKFVNCNDIDSGNPPQDLQSGS